MSLPDISHLQMIVLSALMTRECSGLELREKLQEEKVRKSGPAFYQLMSRLEDAKFVKGWYENKEIDGQVVRERHYRITGGGRAAANAYAAFASRQAVNIGWQS